MTSVSTADSSTIPLRLEQMTVRLGGHAIVDGADLTLAAGEMVLLTGANGAGKSTLLRAVVGLLPYGGDVEVLGRYPTSAEAREQVVFVPDEPALYEDMTLAEHVRFTAILYGRPDAEPIMTGMLERFGLGERLDEFPATHSRGMRQKLSLSLALGLALPLTLLDEPFNGLDLASQERLAESLNGLCAGGGAVLLTGHQGDLQERLAARVAMLEAGRLVA